MLINKKYQIWNSTAQKEKNRPTLQHVKIIRVGEHVRVTPGWLNPTDSTGFNAVALATDGFILSAVPVVVDENDTADLIMWTQLQKAYKISKSKEFYGLTAAIGKTSYDDGTGDIFIPEKGNFPSVLDGYLVPEYFERKARTVSAYNTDLILRCSKSINFPDLTIMTYSFSSNPNEPLILRPYHDYQNELETVKTDSGEKLVDVLRPPFSFVMPMAIKNKNGW